MPSFNKVILLGNLTRDPEMRYTPGGAGVCSFSIALNEKYKDKSSGELKERVDYIDIVAWNKTAENCAQYLHKGDLVMIDGKLQQRRWDDKDTGQKRSKVEVQARSVNFMPKGGTRNGAHGDVPPDVSDAFPGAEPAGDEEIPF